MKAKFFAICIATIGVAHANSQVNVSAEDVIGSTGNSYQDKSISGSGSANANAGLSNAWGLVDTTTGTIKLKTQAVTGANSVWTGAWANASINDTIRINHTEKYADVALDLSFSFASTANYAYSPNDAIRNTQLARTTYDTAGQARAWADFTLRGVDINKPPENSEVPYGSFNFRSSLQFDWQAGPHIALNNPSSQITKQWIDDQYSYSFANLDSTPSSLVIKTVLSIPTNTDIDLNYYVNMESLCSVMGSCNVLLDGTHSFHLGVTALQGTLTSGNGYTYIGAPVPEPESYAMMLAGLGILAGVIRRRKYSRY